MNGPPGAPPLRVLYVVSLFPCWSETFIAREIATLVAAGVDVRILSLKPPSEALVQADAAMLLPRVHHPRGGVGGWVRAIGALARRPLLAAGAVTRVAWRLRRHPVALAKSIAAIARGLEGLDWIERFAPQFVHAHWATYPSTVAMTLAQALRVPFGFTAHAHDIFVADHLLREKIERARLPLTISRYNVEWLARTVTPAARERLEVVHCGVDLAASCYSRAARADDLLVAVGRLDPIKGFDVLVDALALLATRSVRFRCRIIGDGPEHAALQARIERHGLAGRVELCGAQPQEKVQSALREATLFVLPCVIAADGNRDGIPVAMMEAMASGAPVVSTRVAGIPELVGEHEGMLVEPGKPAALADALAVLLADPSRREHIAAAARRKVEREFDARREALRLLALLATAAAGAAAPLRALHGEHA